MCCFNVNIRSEWKCTLSCVKMVFLSSNDFCSMRQTNIKCTFILRWLRRKSLIRGGGVFIFEILNWNNLWFSNDGVFFSKGIKSWFFLLESLLIFFQSSFESLFEIWWSVRWNCFVFDTFLKILLKCFNTVFCWSKLWISFFLFLIYYFVFVTFGKLQ